jgi:hypothetical protein
MGWASGSRLFGQVITAISSEISDDETRRAIYAKIIPAFEDADWDTQDECLGKDTAYDAAINELHPGWFD